MGGEPGIQRFNEKKLMYFDFMDSIAEASR